MAKKNGQSDIPIFILLGVGAFVFLKGKSMAGTVTPAQRALSVALPSSPMIGSSSYNAWVQESLNKLQGSGLVVDGVIGPLTRQAIMVFQTTWGISVDGVIGPETDYYLRSAQGMTGFIDQPYAYTAQNTWS
jgi:peptidoglycan hydrolase-like protein with peptidoglycan-binding domain